MLKKIRVPLKRAISTKVSQFRKRNLSSNKLRLKKPRNKNKIQVRKESRRKDRRVSSNNSNHFRLPNKSQGPRIRRAMRRTRRVRGRKGRTTLTV